MEFISVEEFLEQPEEVQEIFLSWFNENVWAYDLVQEEDIIMLYKDYVEERISVEYDSYPLFTEGQLRRFIEDKTGYHLEISTEFGTGFYIADFYKNNKSNRPGRMMIKTQETDLLQAYWKVACEIAKESVENGKNN